MFIQRKATEPAAGRGAGRLLAGVLIGLVVTLALACDQERDRGEGPGGVHPVGWADKDSSAFHAEYLKAAFAQATPSDPAPLDECRGCHGDDFGGGAVGVPCSNSTCHTHEGGPQFCGTCHGSDSGPLPTSNGAHADHEQYCDFCHVKPKDLSDHPNGSIDLVFSGLATTGGLTPSWDPDARRCNNVYCHRGTSPVWDDTTKLDCNGCHDTPAIHGRFVRVVNRDTCANCHAGSPDNALHLDGKVTVAIDGCNGCHGGYNGGPPPALNGSTDPTDHGVGAHRHHLDSTLPGRIGKIVACTTCHKVPDTVLAAGHIDSSAPADVKVAFGDYDPATQSCTVWCHGNGNPVWTNDSGSARACGACHGFPPEQTFDGGPHPVVLVQSDTDVTPCRLCHLFDPTTHVNGEVNFQ